jgi:uncharacterized protein (DUF1684 family)
MRGVRTAQSRRAAWVGYVAGVLAVLAASACHREPAVAQVQTHQQQVQQWRDQHEADYRRDWVTVAALHFLEPGVHTIGSRPGSTIVLAASAPADVGKVIVEGVRVRFEPAPGIEARQSDKPVTGPVVMKAPDERPAPDIVIGDIRLVVHVTGDRMALRVRDPNSAQAKAFRGFTWFPIDPAYRVVARFIRDAEPRQLRVPNTLDALDPYSTEGVLEFSLNGRTLRLRPFTTRPKRFYIVFRDASSGTETYQVARFLYADLRDDGTAVLDFNQAYNPPCAFNPFTTCPLPLKENILPVKILAGEQAYGS